ncbi:MAG: hypothetical protein M1816_004087 [Peltula sp. TS41687]|nr:MAG: hypothetical protein M1816_004087 [Peltula sp. TS41687]
MSGPMLQLFPAPPSEMTRPKRKVSRRNATKPRTLAEQAKTSTTSVKEIVIQVTENGTTETTSRPGSPDVHNVKDAPRPSSPPIRSLPPPQSRTLSPALSKERLETSSVATTSLSRAASPALTNAPSVLSGSTTLVRSNSDVSRVAPPMRSMFPQYNPAVPLSQQNYRPTQASPTHIPPAIISKEPYSPSLYSAASPGQASAGRGCLSAPSAITSFPVGVLNNHRPRYSSLEELVDLWEAANGQGTEEMGRMFALKMSREGSINPTSGSFVPAIGESFTFGPSKDQPFYDFQTLKPNSYSTEFSECHIRRRDPRKGTIIPVMSFNLEPASRRNSPQDGLVTTLYPKIAAMMALDNASHLRTSASIGEDIDTLRSSAVREAAKKEECKLFWDHDSQRYYLLHPGLKSSSPHSNNESGEGGSEGGQRFVIVPEPGVGFDVPGARGTIRLMDTTPANNTLLSLEFGSATLLVDTSATIAIPSFYMVDIAISALIAVALVEGRKARSSSSSGLQQQQPQHRPAAVQQHFVSPTTATTMGPTSAPPPTPLLRDIGAVEQQQQQQQPENSKQQSGTSTRTTPDSSPKGVLAALFSTLSFVVGVVATMLMGFLGACFAGDPQERQAAAAAGGKK